MPTALYLSHPVSPAIWGGHSWGGIPRAWTGWEVGKLRASPRVAVCEAGGQTESTLLKLGMEVLTPKQDELQKQGHLRNQDLGRQWRESEPAGIVEPKCTFCAVSLQALLGSVCL